MTKLAFVDVETTGLDPDLHEIWEVGLILRDEDGAESRYEWELPVDLGRADPVALTISRYYERSADADLFGVHIGGGVRFAHRHIFAADFARATHGAHLVGACIDFDAKRLERLLRSNGACPGWHYHIVDVEAMAAGYVSALCRRQANDGVSRGMIPVTRADGSVTHLDGRPPWDSDLLSRAVGVNPDLFARHTAIGDALWAQAIYDAVVKG